MVRVQGEVEDVMGPLTFTLDEDRVFAGPDLLVLMLGSIGEAPEDKRVTVEGVIRPLVMSELERDYDWFEHERLGPDIQARMKERPLLVADSVWTEDGRQLVKRASADKAVARAGAANDDTLRDVMIIITAVDTDAFVGRRVELDKMMVRQVLSDKMVLVGDADRPLLVRVAETQVRGTPEINKGDLISISGTLQRVPEKASELGLSRAEAKRLKDHRLYLNATRLEVVRKAGSPGQG